jgi:hypothetical protein
LKRSQEPSTYLCFRPGKYSPHPSILFLQRCILILSYHLRLNFLSCLFPSGFLTKIFICISHFLRSLLSSSTLVWLVNCHVSGIKDEAPQHGIFSILLSLCISYVSQTPSIYVTLMWETTFHTRTEQRVNL